MNTIGESFRKVYAINASANSGMIKRENFGKPTGQENPKKDNRSTGKNPKSFGQILKDMQKERE